MNAEALGTLGTKLALQQQAVGLSVIKQAAEAEQALANVIAQAAQTVPASQNRGSNVNITA